MSLWREEKGSREKGRNHTTDEVASLFKRKAEQEGLSSTSIRYVSERDERRSSFYAFYLRKGDSISCGRLAICQSPPFPLQRDLTLLQAEHLAGVVAPAWRS